MRALPTDHAGRIVPWFVAWPNGKPDHRIVRAEAPADALRDERCWICGQALGMRHVFVIGPMCLVNRVTVEPPSHHECAEYAAKACPFLSRPHMRRSQRAKPDRHEPPPGIMLDRNPGVTVLWTAIGNQPHNSYAYHPEPHDGRYLIRLHNPANVEWYTEGRLATHAEALEALDTGLPNLRKLAAEDGIDAQFELRLMENAARRLLP